jgi:hypothetical protein
MTIDAVGFAEKMHADVQSGAISTHGYGKSMRYLATRLYPDLDEGRALAKLFTTAAGKLFERPFTSPMSVQQNYVKGLAEGSVKIAAEPVAKRIETTESYGRLERRVAKYADENGVDVSAAWGRLDDIPEAGALMAADRAERLHKGDSTGREPFAMDVHGDDPSGGRVHGRRQRGQP